MGIENYKGKTTAGIWAFWGAIIAALITGIVALIVADKIPFPFRIAPTLPFSLSVPANAGWVGTGFHLQNGQSIIISANGIVDTDIRTIGNEFSPIGSETLCDRATFEQWANQKYSIDCFLSGAPLGAVIGRVGNSTPFLIGSSLQFTSVSVGELFLAVNDCCSINDNSGSFSVTIARP